MLATHGGGVEGLLEKYSSHVYLAGFVLQWANTRVDGAKARSQEVKRCYMELQGSTIQRWDA